MIGGAREGVELAKLDVPLIAGIHEAVPKIANTN